ncbi:MAG: ABC transporter permease [Bacteriovoracaceae bacterium]|nr:ABC transporter permease [Bacteriovoracaceae bacterium]
MKHIQNFIIDFGWARIIIGLFLLSLFILAPVADVRIDTSISDTVARFGMACVLVLAMVPMIQSGCGLNFGLPLGIIAGLLGATCTMELELKGLIGLSFAMLITTVFGTIFGFFYGKLLNKVKGSEMMIATYVGFSSVAFMCMMWLLLPFKNPKMIWGYGGSGLRTTITVEGYWLHVLNNFLSFRVSESFVFPTGMILFVLFMCLLIWGFFHTKLGSALTAVGSNPDFAKASGVDIDKMRVISVILSTVLGGIGILVYQQSFGFIQLYMGPFYMAFPAVAAILIGGASINKATITNVIVGTFLFQGILTMTPSVMNSLIHTDMSEVIRIIVSNGMIIYAMTRVNKARQKK